MCYFIVSPDDWHRSGALPHHVGAIMVELLKTTWANTPKHKTNLFWHMARWPCLFRFPYRMPWLLDVEPLNTHAEGLERAVAAASRVGLLEAHRACYLLAVFVANEVDSDATAHY